MIVTLKDIARETGLSQATVSLALAGSPLVSEKTGKRVQEAAERMGYVPNAAARNLVGRASDTVGLIVPDISNPYFGALAQEIDGSTRKFGCRLLIATSNDSHEIEKEIIDQFVSNRVKGVLIAPTNYDVVHTEFIRKLEKYDIKYLFVTSYYQNIKAPCVMTDLEKGSFDLVNYLLDLGHEDIYMLGADRDIIPTYSRAEGYRRAYRAHGLEADEARFVNCISTTFERAYGATLQLLADAANLDAIICINDIMALGTLRALLDKGIRVPQQVSVAGYDDVIFASVSAIPITTVRQDIKALGSLAVDTLFDMIGRGWHDRRVMIEPELIVRRSTGKKHAATQGR